MAERKKEDRAATPKETRAKTTDEAIRAEAEAKSDDDTQTSTVNSETEEVDVAGLKVKREVGYWVVGDQRYHSLAQAYRAAEGASNDEDN